MLDQLVAWGGALKKDKPRTYFNVEPFPSSFRAVRPTSTIRQARDTGPVPILLSDTPLWAAPADRQYAEPLHPIPFVEAAG